MPPDTRMCTHAQVHARAHASACTGDATHACENSGRPGVWSWACAAWSCTSRVSCCALLPCKYACTHAICTYVYEHVSHVHVCGVCRRTYACTRACARTRKHTRTHAHTHARTHACVSACMRGMYSHIWQSEALKNSSQSSPLPRLP